MPVLPVGFDREATKADCPDLLAANGPTAICLIGFDPDYDPKNPQMPPKLPTTTRHGLIDTGASNSSIDEILVKELNLPVVDKKPVSGVHGQAELDVCSAQIFCPDLAIQSSVSLRS